MSCAGSFHIWCLIKEKVLDIYSKLDFSPYITWPFHSVPNSGYIFILTLGLYESRQDQKLPYRFKY